jgi:hypothetical protein
MNWKGSRRERLWLHLRYYPSYSLYEIRETMKALRITGLQTKISTRYLKNKEEEWYILGRNC